MGIILQLDSAFAICHHIFRGKAVANSVSALVCVTGRLINPSTICNLKKFSCVAAHITFVIRDMTKMYSKYSQISSGLPWLLDSFSMHLQEHSKEGRCNSCMSAVQSLLSTADKAGIFKTMLLMRCGLSEAFICFILCLPDARKYYLSLGFRPARSSSVSLVEQVPTVLAIGQLSSPQRASPCT